MKKPLTYYGDPALRRRCDPVQNVDEETGQLVQDLIDTLEETNNGIGLSAPQINASHRVFITHVPVQDEEGNWENGVLRVFINPEILSYSEETAEEDEGCLSIPNLYGPVTRPYKVTVKALDEHGKPFSGEYSGLEARCIMHENDHINGVLFIDRVKGKARRQLEPGLRQIKKKYSS